MSWKSGAAASMWIPVLNAAEAKNDIPHDLLARQCFEESGFNPEATNPSGAVGIMQLLKEYFPNAGKDPVADIESAAEYLASLFKRFNDWQLALAGYDWGPTILAKTIKKLKGNITLVNLPPETSKYVSQIITDVPVQGILCKTPSLPTSQPPGTNTSQARKPSEVLSSGSSSGSSWFSRLTSIWTKSPPQSLPLLASGLSKPSLPTSFPTNQQEIDPVSTPNPILKAAAPTLVTALQELQTALNTILTGDPAQIPLRAGPAVAIMIGQLELLLPGLAAAETGVVQSDINTKIGGLITKLQALNASAPNPVPPPVQVT
jgi:Transglycosylase SLT domain